jgi:hypothetical protein
MKRIIVLAMTVLFVQISTQGATVVQFVRQTATGPGYVPVAGNWLTLPEALELADLDLMRDTRLTQQQINDFIAGQGAIGCFTTPMVDPENGVELGTGIDCLNPNGAGLRALSLFLFHGGTLVTFGQTSVNSFAAGIGDAGGAVTHMTGSIPPAPGGDPSGIVGGTGRFRRASGIARVSGAVNLNDFPTTMDFDCVWILHIDPRGRP